MTDTLWLVVTALFISVCLWVGALVIRRPALPVQLHAEDLLADLWHQVLIHPAQDNWTFTNEQLTLVDNIVLLHVGLQDFAEKYPDKIWAWEYSLAKDSYRMSWRVS